MVKKYIFLINIHSLLGIDDFKKIVTFFSTL